MIFRKSTLEVIDTSPSCPNSMFRAAKNGHATPKASRSHKLPKLFRPRWQPKRRSEAEHDGDRRQVCRDSKAIEHLAKMQSMTQLPCTTDARVDGDGFGPVRGGAPRG